jgi:hypothetical protein
MRDLRWGLFTGILSLAIGCNQAVVADAKQRPDAKIYKRTDITSVVQDYKKWKVAKPDLFKVQPAVWTLCIGPTQEQAAILDASHTGFIKVFVNDIGQEAMFAKTAFPVGSIIVKERHPTKVSGVEFCTVMRKREKGYNPECGDWEFSVLNEQNIATDVGRLKACMGCHSKQGKLDFTFRTYLDKKEGIPIDLWQLEQKK